MKKLLFATVITVTISGTGYCVTQCVKIPETFTSCSEVSATDTGDWSLTCDGQTYRGVSKISNDDNSLTADCSGQDYCSLDCYCKMTYPVETEWVRMYSAPNLCSDSYECSILTLADAARHCGWYCIDDEYDGSNEAMLNTIRKILENIKA